MENQLITENYTPALRDMNVGDTLIFPVKAHNSIKSTLIPRVRIELCVENADWEVGEIDKKNGTFPVKRIS
ncbi:hypothetical protein [Bacteroides sp.]|uniref:hypothetical protein n=1 Tax=Bacteroides sp. TaxID=29523 RepID=UPI0025C391F5|nr:hypothetical protein [Bacteroides sp.]